MNKVSNTTATEANKNTAMTASPQSKNEKTAAAENRIAPLFVEAEKMLEKLADVTKETAQKAYEFFQKRGGELGRELDDWFKAESMIMRPVPVKVTETKDFVNVRAVVAGFKPEEIEISVKGNELFLSGKTESQEKKEDENTFYSEWRSNHFCRRLTLPSEVSADSVQANLKDGVLELSLPKVAEQEAAKISVKTA
jgi:HSP20 family protein